MDPQKSEKSEEKKRWGEELRGIAYLAISLLLFASLFTYSPDDTSLNSLSTSPVVKNLTGLLGAYTSDILFSLFGGAASLFPLALSIIGWKRLKGGQKGSFAGRSIGFIVLLLSLPAFLHLHLERISVSIKWGIPAVGLLGNIITSALTSCCAFFGAHVITLTLVIISVLWTTGITPSKLIFSAGGKMNGPFLWVRNTLFKRKGKKREKKVTADTAIEEDLFILPPPIGEPKIIEQRPVEKLPPQQEHFEFMDTTPDGAYRLPPLALLSDPPPMVSKVDKEDLLMNSNVLEKKLLDFGIEGQIVQVHPGPVITMYEFEPAPGVKISRIVNLSDDLALAMKSGSVRIVAPLPGGSTVGIG